MDRVNAGIEQFDNTVKGWMDALDRNEYVSSAIILFLIVYAGLAAPRLPENVIRIFDYTVVKLVVLFLIAYGARKNPTVAIIAAIGLIVTLQVLNWFKINRRFMSLMQRQETDTRMPPQMQQHAQMQQRMPEHPEEVRMEDGHPEDQIPEESLIGLHEASSQPGMAQEAGAGCARKANYRNNFYPQYVNMKPDAYMSRYTGSDATGYDANSRYVNHSTNSYN